VLARDNPCRTPNVTGSTRGCLGMLGLCELHFTPFGRPMERCRPILLPDGHIGAMLNQKPCEFYMTSGRRSM
jgi:hypothetical protein